MPPKLDWSSARLVSARQPVRVWPAAPCQRSTGGPCAVLVRRRLSVRIRPLARWGACWCTVSPCKPDGIGSIPMRSTHAPIVQLVEAPALEAGVGGSNPSWGTQHVMSRRSSLECTPARQAGDRRFKSGTRRAIAVEVEAPRPESGERSARFPGRAHGSGPTLEGSLSARQGVANPSRRSSVGGSTPSPSAHPVVLGSVLGSVQRPPRRRVKPWRARDAADGNPRRR